MATTHPYISGVGNLAKMVGHLRKSFPATITSETVKKLGLAPNNESYVINALQFINVIDEEGKKTPEAAKIFLHHKDDEFVKAFEVLIKRAYSALFDLHGNNTWDLDENELITFFRQSDQTSAAIGKRQASTFRMFASLSGHGELPTPRESGTKKKTSSSKISKASKKKKEKAEQLVDIRKNAADDKNIGLTVRIEINLPADGSKETYNNIFKSIKENLLDV